MALTLLCVGKARESYYREAVAEYRKRLSTLTPCQVVEVADEPEPRQLSGPAVERALRAESERLLARIPAGAYVFALCVDAGQPSSEELADKIRNLFLSGRNELVFVVGGSLGLHESVMKRADETLSLGRITMPHQLARVVMIEQLYRAAKINAGQRYHK